MAVKRYNPFHPYQRPPNHKTTAHEWLPSGVPLPKGAIPSHPRPGGASMVASSLDLIQPASPPSPPSQPLPAPPTTAFGQAIQIDETCRFASISSFLSSNSSDTSKFSNSTFDAKRDMTLTADRAIPAPPNLDYKHPWKCFASGGSASFHTNFPSEFYGPGDVPQNHADTPQVDSFSSQVSSPTHTTTACLGVNLLSKHIISGRFTVFNYGGKTVCCGGHTLQERTEPTGFTCDSCDGEILAGEKVFECAICDYGLCTSCFNAAAPFMDSQQVEDDHLPGLGATAGMNEVLAPINADAMQGFNLDCQVESCTSASVLQYFQSNEYFADFPALDRANYPSPMIYMKS